MAAQTAPFGELSTGNADLRGSQLGARVQRLLDQRMGEFAVLGLGLSGESAARLLYAHGIAVYASDNGTSGEVTQQQRVSPVRASRPMREITTCTHWPAVWVVVSPGIPPGVPPLKAAHQGHIPIVSEVEVGLRLLKGVRYIAVTGTNGKTTTTALIAHLLQALGLRAAEAGNIGTPVSQIALDINPPEWLALELSSFQLHDTPVVKPAVGVLTNLTPDHLDRYHNSTTEYYADKALLFANADAESCWVVPGEGTEAMEMTAELPGRTLRFSTTRTDVDGSSIEQAAARWLAMRSLTAGISCGDTRGNSWRRAGVCQRICRMPQPRPRNAPRREFGDALPRRIDRSRTPRRVCVKLRATNVSSTSSHCTA